MASIRSALLMSLAALATARDIPANVQDFYNSVKAKGECSNKLASNFHSMDKDDGSFSYCGDHLADSNVVYLQGKGGNLVNMDIDCDGIQNGPTNDGRCGSSSDTQSQTSFQGTVKAYGTGQKDLDAFIHPYVVFGNDGSKPNWPKFKPQSVGVQPLSVMAVVCNNKLIYGIWGDTNGDDGKEAMVGEASISVATACYGSADINGNAGHDENDVLYIAFTGDDAVPGKSAKWNAKSYDEFAASINDLGDKLIQRLGSNGNNPPASSSSAAPSSTAAASSTATSISTSEPTSTNTVEPTSASSSFTTSVTTATSEPTSATTTTTAVSSAPATTAPSSTGVQGCPAPPASTASIPPASTSTKPAPPASSNCSWKGHCEGATCRSGNDCSDDLVCKSGRCAAY